MPRTLSKRYLETQQCVIPDEIKGDPLDLIDAEESAPRSPTTLILEPVSVATACPLIIQSGTNKGQMCGKPIVSNGLCKRHLTLSNEERPKKRPRLVEPVEGRCPCKTQKGFYCGAEIQPGTSYCKRHQNCPPAALVEAPAPEEDILATEEEIRQVEEPELVIPPEEDAEMEVVPPIEADLLQREEWTVQYVSDTTEMMDILGQMAVVDVDEQRMQFLEAKIRACFE